MACFPHPLISVITPALNAAQTITDTLRSVAETAEILASHGAAIEHLIMDGGSTDGTQELVGSYQQCLTDAQDLNYKCSLFSSADAGIYTAMNAGLRKSNGFYTHILNADDYILNPSLYAESILSLFRQRHCVLLSSIIYFQRPDYRQGPHWHLEAMPDDPLAWKNALLKGLHFPHPGFIARTDIYRQQSFDVRYKVSADYKLMQVLLLKEELQSRVSICSEPLVAMAKGGVTGSWRGIYQGAIEISSINHELGISGSLLSRYWNKLVMRIIS